MGDEQARESSPIVPPLFPQFPHFPLSPPPLPPFPPRFPPFSLVSPPHYPKFSLLFPISPRFPPLSPILRACNVVPWRGGCCPCCGMVPLCPPGALGRRPRLAMGRGPPPIPPHPLHRPPALVRNSKAPPAPPPAAHCCAQAGYNAFWMDSDSILLRDPWEVLPFRHSWEGACMVPLPPPAGMNLAAMDPRIQFRTRTRRPNVGLALWRSREDTIRAQQRLLWGMTFGFKDFPKNELQDEFIFQVLNCGPYAPMPPPPLPQGMCLNCCTL